MNYRELRSVLVLGSLGLAGLAPACCGVARSQLTFADQSNIIVWDEKTKTEHFVRIAGFYGADDQIGFLAPTPTTPTLAEADRRAFAELAMLRPVPATLGRPTRGTGGGGAGSAPVRITQQVEVGGYVATTFEATDSNALTAYLAKYGFPLSLPQQKWVRNYVKKKWVITAFQVQMKEGRGATSPIRLSFKTEKPYNPYYVPEDNRRSGAGLRLFFIGNGTFRGKLEDGRPWESGREEFRIGLREHDRVLLAKRLKLKPEQIGTTLVSTFDQRFPTPDEQDLFFEKVSSKIPELPKNHIRLVDMAPGGGLERFIPKTY